ncbi:selection and upkeep of intraepithelial T-cells protein 1-like [Archocentrus centrarchus]|uniref:selection and upkeep of intraepithelial T-cells protein 1-like n=1 Tax=Archocentrus centrarchus TaxID=63155 RepID=UPI0011EA486A|nr:selection and upkeep of intraepithelial T-cells protein 1-like [Archocentrus centrarchus]
MEKMICRILLLLILTSCVSGSFVVNVTQTSYQAEENHNITLEWTFTTNPDRSIKTLNILCGHNTGQNTSVLYRVHEGVEVSESQDAKFSGRVQSDKDALREGRIRLQVSRLRTDDSGLYLCEVNTDDGFSVGRCTASITAADDQLQPQRPTTKPPAESGGMTGFYILMGVFSVIQVIVESRA